jgi:transcriptional regulator with XRE-family HTH domain
MTDTPMKRSAIAKILKRHKGSKAEVARRSKVKHNVVSMWLSGGSNANVAEQAEIHARELLAREEAERLTRGEANGPSAKALVEAIRKGDPAVAPLVEQLKKKTSSEGV